MTNDALTALDELLNYAREGASAFGCDPNRQNDNYETIRQALNSPENMPVINAMFEVQSEGLTGSTDAKIIRVEKQDDGSFAVVIDHWPKSLTLENDRLKADLAAERTEVERLKRLLNTPEVEDFAKGVVMEAGHQRERWGASHDAGKAPLDWFWLIGHLSQKAATAAMNGDIEKAKHHTISTSAALANWHLALSGADNSMRPGIDLSAAQAQEKA